MELPSIGNDVIVPALSASSKPVAGQTLAEMYVLATASNQMGPDKTGRATHNDNTAAFGRLTITNGFRDRWHS
jgi:hypothetical protein